MKYKWNKKYLYWGLTFFFVIMASIFVIYVVYQSSRFVIAIKRIVSVSMPLINGVVIAYLLSPILTWVENSIVIPIYNMIKTSNTNNMIIHNNDIISNTSNTMIDSEKNNIHDIKGNNCNDSNIQNDNNQTEISESIIESIRDDKHINKIKKRIRIISLLISVTLVIAGITTFFMVVVPQLVISIQKIILQFPIYIINLNIWLGKILSSNPGIEAFAKDIMDNYSEDVTTMFNKNIFPKVNDLMQTISLGVIGILTSAWNLLIGFIISIYLLGSRETFIGQFKKCLYAIFDNHTANNLLDDIRFVNHTFGGFISGKLLDSLIIGIICYICILFIGTPFPILISVIIGVTNVIPFFGPYLGAIPSIILILMVDPLQALYFAIFVLVLQQFDGNFLGPKILGDSTGLSSFWVIFAIIIFGGFFGIFGMVIGVPAFAVIYVLIHRHIIKRLRKKQLPEETKKYISLGRINSDNKIIEYKHEELRSFKKNKTRFHLPKKGIEEQDKEY